MASVGKSVPIHSKRFYHAGSIASRAHHPHYQYGARMHQREAHIHFSYTEITSILVTVFTLIAAFYMFRVFDAGIVVGIVLGVTLHEISHKLVAQSMGFESRYKLWEIGLVLVVAFAIITRGRFIFAAPGFVVTEGEATTAERGKISLAAPAANIFLAVLFLGMGAAWYSAAYVNALLGVFNLLPVAPLDGFSVREWDRSVWSAALAISLTLVVVSMLRIF